MRQGAQGQCTGMTLRDGMGREVGGGFRMGDPSIPMADSCQCIAKTLQYCKVISLQLNKLIFKKPLCESPVNLLGVHSISKSHIHKSHRHKLLFNREDLWDTSLLKGLLYDWKYSEAPPWPNKGFDGHILGFICTLFSWQYPGFDLCSEAIHVSFCLYYSCGVAPLANHLLELDHLVPVNEYPMASNSAKYLFLYFQTSSIIII